MKAIDKIVRVDPQYPDVETISQAADLIRQGQVVVFPTQGLYGLGADALSQTAVNRIFGIKERDSNKPLIVLIDHLRMMDQLAPAVNPMARLLINELWPGKVTFVVQAHDHLPTGLTSNSGKIGIRLTAHPVAKALIRAASRPITGTSANLSGAAGCSSISNLSPSVCQMVSLVLDAGALSGGIGSSIVDVSGIKPAILREGAVPTDEIMAAFDRFTV